MRRTTGMTLLETVFAAGILAMGFMAVFQLEAITSVQVSQTRQREIAFSGMLKARESLSTARVRRGSATDTNQWVLGPPAQPFEIARDAAGVSFSMPDCTTMSNTASPIAVTGPNNATAPGANNYAATVDGITGCIVVEFPVPPLAAIAKRRHAGRAIFYLSEAGQPAQGATPPATFPFPPTPGLTKLDCDGLLSVVHEPSQQAAIAVIVAMGGRAPIDDERASALVTAWAKCTVPQVKNAHARLLSRLAEVNTGPSLGPALRRAYDRSDAEGQAALLPPLLRSLPEHEAHDVIESILRNEAAEPGVLATAIAELPHKAGTFADLPLLIARVQGRSSGVAKRPLDRLELVVLVSAANLAHKPRFASVAELLTWWEAIRPRVEAQEKTIADIDEGGPKGAAAIQSLAEIHTREVDAALRKAASSNASDEIRLLAAQTIVVRGDRRGVRAIVEGLRKATGARRDLTLQALRTLSKGGGFPEDDPDQILAWWEERFPDDVRE